MRRYKAIDKVRLGGGDVVVLSNDQAVDRSASLEALGDGVYKVLAPQEFKVGEIIGFLDDPAKHLTALFECLDPPEPEVEVVEEVVPEPEVEVEPEPDPFKGDEPKPSKRRGKTKK